MRLSFWEHYGVISVEKIKKKTGAKRVLALATGRCNVAGASLVAFPFWRTPSINPETDLIVREMWEYVWKENQYKAVVFPNAFLRRETQRKAMYRVVQLPRDEFWVEARSSKYKIGKTFQQNKFLLVFEDDKTERLNGSSGSNG